MLGRGGLDPRNQLAFPALFRGSTARRNRLPRMKRQPRRGRPSMPLPALRGPLAAALTGLLALTHGAQAQTRPAPIRRDRRGARRLRRAQRLPGAPRAARQPGPAASAAGRGLGPEGAADLEIHKATRALRDTPRWRWHSRDAVLRFPAAAETFSCALGGPSTTRDTPHTYIAVAPFVGRCRSGHLQGQGHLPAQATVRRARRGHLHAERGSGAGEGWLPPVRPFLARMGLGPDPGWPGAERAPMR